VRVPGAGREKSVSAADFRIGSNARMSRRIHSFALAWLFLCLAPAHGESLTVSVKQRNGKPLIGAVVTLETPGLPAAAPVSAIMDQVDLAFVPDVLVIPLRSSVLFPNSDAISHQVYSFSNARQFQLPLYRGKPYPPVTFERAGVVTLGCNIHDNMLAYIVVTAAPYFGRTAANGEWTAPDVPAGRYNIRVWHPLGHDTQEIEGVVQPGAANSRVELRLARDLKPAPLTGRPHSWDY
jgi:plastocyanin